MVMQYEPMDQGDVPRRTPSALEQQLRTPLGLLALLALPRVGAQTALRIALATSNYDDLLERHLDDWEGHLAAGAEQLTRYSEAGVRVVCYFDDLYPDRLRALHDPPPLLYVHGSIELLRERRAVAVIGTREPTSFGITAADELTAALAADHWVVVSGLAKGIDTLAHGAALKYHTPTVAVLGSGLDRIYPAENRELAMAIVDQGGALVSEQPFGSRPHAGNLVARNRLQTGLSVAVLLIQSGIKGGSMHTARHAATQGKPIFCPVPHKSHERSAGIEALLQQPANRLCDLFPAWKDASALCARLGSNPLGQPVERSNMSGFLDALDRALHEPQLSPESRWWAALPEAELQPRLIADDDEPSLFVFSG